MPTVSEARQRAALELKAAELGCTIKVAVTVTGPSGARSSASEHSGVPLLQLLEEALAAYQRGMT